MPCRGPLEGGEPNEVVALQGFNVNDYEQALKACRPLFDSSTVPRTPSTLRRLVLKEGGERQIWKKSSAELSIAALAHPKFPTAIPGSTVSQRRRRESTGKSGVV
ncbi:hypothetical protein C8034_v012185 [Colletotrichum sidae]|uniref:Uncharacterized protein n=1 Tax=Colletotrichum sidae TaxID=1347389 RepID=A0A4R8THM0_9PEZI|nr:hypothetical protein C8034_v012185 [Colletotrichum sidae]